MALPLSRRAAAGRFSLLRCAVHADATSWRWADEARGRPFAKDPSVVRFNERYLRYHSIPPYGDGRADDGCHVTQ